MAVTVKANLYDAVQGARIEIGTFTLDPDSLAANTEVEETVTLSGAEVGDLVFVDPQQLDAGLVVKGARISATDTLAITLRNVTDADVDGAERTWEYVLVKLG